MFYLLALNVPALAEALGLLVPAFYGVVKSHKSVTGSSFVLSGLFFYLKKKKIKIKMGFCSEFFPSRFWVLGFFKNSN